MRRIKKLKLILSMILGFLLLIIGLYGFALGNGSQPNPEDSGANASEDTPQSKEDKTQLKPEDPVAEVDGKIIRYKEIKVRVPVTDEYIKYIKRRVNGEQILKVDEKMRQAFILEREREHLFSMIRTIITRLAIEEAKIEVTQEELDKAFEEDCRIKGITVKEREDMHKEYIENRKVEQKAIKYWKKHPGKKPEDIYDKFLSSLPHFWDKEFWVKSVKERNYPNCDAANKFITAKPLTLEQLKYGGSKASIKHDKFEANVLGLKGIKDRWENQEVYLKWRKVWDDWLDKQFKKRQIEILVPKYEIVLTEEYIKVDREKRDKNTQRSWQKLWGIQK